MVITYPIKFKAAVLREIGGLLDIETIEYRGPLSVGQVLVKLSYSGICGKQIEEMDGLGGVDEHLPHLLGHEEAVRLLILAQVLVKFVLEI